MLNSGLLKPVKFPLFKSSKSDASKQSGMAANVKPATRLLTFFVGAAEFKRPKGPQTRQARKFAAGY
jgi:hypothetical protein